MATEVAAECAPFVVRYLAGDLCGFPALAIRAVEFGLWHQFSIGVFNPKV
jgi:hypothetical protein